MTVATANSLSRRIPPKQAARLGQDVSLGKGETMPLGWLKSGYAIQSGRLEIYVASDGHRTFLGEVPAGAVIPEGAAGTTRSGAELHLYAADATTLAPLSAQLLSKTKPEALASAIDGWVMALSAAVAHMLTDRPDIFSLSAGKTAKFDRPVSLSAGHGVIWLLPDPAAERVLLDRQPIAPEGAYPVNNHIWITSKPATYQGLATLQVVARPGWMDLLVRFAQDMAEAAIELARGLEAGEAGRVLKRQELAAEGLSESLNKFRSVLVEKNNATESESEHAFLFRLLNGSEANQKSVKAKPEDFADFVALNECRLRPIKLPDQWWTKDVGRFFIRRLDDGKSFVMAPSWRGYRAHSFQGAAQLVTRDDAAHFEDKGLVLFRPLDNKPIKVLDILLAGLRMCRADLAVLTAATAFAALLGLLLPIATGALVDTYIPASMRSPVLLIGLGLVVAQAVMSSVNLVTSLLKVRMDGVVAGWVDPGVIDRLLRLPSVHTRSMPSANLNMRVNAVNGMRKAIMGVVLNALMSGITGLAGLFLLLYYSPLAGAMAVGSVMVMTAIGVWMALKQTKAIYEGETMTANVISFSQQMIENMPVLKSFSAEERAFNRWAVNAAEMRSRGLRARRIGNMFAASLSAYQTIAVALVLGVIGFSLGPDTGLSTGAYMVFISTFQNFMAAGVILARGANQLVALKPQYTLAKPLLDNVPETAPTAQDPGSLSGEIKVNNLSFEHQEGRPILSSVSFHVPSGGFTALVGPSGSGKSTLMALLAGFEKPNEGAILYNDRDLGGLDLAKVRRQIGYVRQGGRLFAGTLFENIAGPNDPSIDDVWAAAEQACVADDIRALPMGLHTMITEGSAAFSGGQVQRLLLARAFLGRPKILFLDEATSALDQATERAVSKNIETMGATRVVIAHNLHTIRYADMILFLESGKITESGTYDQLLAQGRKFAAFVALASKQ